MKFKVINGEPLQFHNTSGDLTGTIIMSSSGDMVIRPESGSNKDVIIGDLTTTGTVEIGTTAAPTTLNLVGGGTITSNGYTLYIGDTADTVIIRNALLNNAFYTQSLVVTGSITSHQGVFFGNGSGLTDIIPNFTGSGITSGSFTVIGPTTIQTTTINGTSNLNGQTNINGNVEITGSLKVSGSSELSSSIHVTVSSGSSSINMGVGVSKFIPFSYLADQTNIYTDRYIQISYDTSGTDPELTILTGPTSGRIQVHLFNSATAAESTIDMLTNTLTDIFSTGLLSDTRLDCTISAGADSNWPFYRMTWFRSNTTYGGNIQVLIERFYI